MNQYHVSDQDGRNDLVTSLKKNQVVLTASICLFALVVVLKNVLLVPYDTLMRDVVIYIIIYFGFVVFALKIDDKEDREEALSPLLWDAVIVIITLAIMAIYAL